MHYLINPFNKFVKGRVADRVQDSCNKGLKFVNVQFLYQANSMWCRFQWRCSHWKDGRTHTMNTNYSLEKSKEYLKFYIINCPLHSQRTITKYCIILPFIWSRYASCFGQIYWSSSGNHMRRSFNSYLMLLQLLCSQLLNYYNRVVVKIQLEYN